MENSPTPSQDLAAWTAVIDALGSPAAIVDANGMILSTNRPDEAEVGSRIVQRSKAVAPDEGDDDEAPTATWDVRSITQDGNFRLATTAVSNPAEMLMQQFFFLADRLFVVYDTRGKILQANKAWRDLLGYDLDELFSISSWELLPPDDRITQSQVEHELRHTGASEPTYQMRTATGEYRTVRWSLQFDQLNNRCYGIGRDITEELQATEDLTRRAFTDDLTGLANRAALLDELDLWLSGPFTPALLFCDLDGFKRINDSLGHHSGDSLLTSLAERLVDTVAGPDAMVARFGGDEFVILLGAATSQRAADIAAKVLESLKSPFRVSGHDVHLSMSIGIGISDSRALPKADLPEAATTLLERADAAAYQAKRAGTSRYAVHNGTSDEVGGAYPERIRMESALRSAIETEAFEVLYQPIVSLPDGNVIGAEALGFWRTDDGSLISADEFRSIADEAGLMPEIAAQISRIALQETAELTRDWGPFTISLSSSGRQLGFADYPNRLLSEIERARISPSRVALQIPEAVSIASSEVLPQLTTLHDAGLRLTLDRFGGDYSAMERIRNLPIASVRLDQTMTVEISDLETSKSLAHSMIAILKVMGVDVILEGATTPEDVAAGWEAGATMAQDYRFQAPLTSVQLCAVLADDSQPLRRAA